MILLSILPFLCVSQLVAMFSSDYLIYVYHWTIMGIVIAVLHHPGVRQSGSALILVLNSPSSVVNNGALAVESESDSREEKHHDN